MVGMGAAPLWLQRTMYASDSTTGRKKILVAIFQRGAADGLNIVVPHGEKRYYELRPTLNIPQPSASVAKEQSVIDLDGMFGFNPALAALKPVWDAGHLAMIHAAGSPDPTRSHFDAQDYMESGTPGMKSIEGGWMNRALLPVQGKESPVRAVSLGASLPRSLRKVQKSRPWPSKACAHSRFATPTPPRSSRASISPPTTRSSTEPARKPSRPSLF